VMVRVAVRDGVGERVGVGVIVAVAEGAGERVAVGGVDVSSDCAVAAALVARELASAVLNGEAGKASPPVTGMKPACEVAAEAVASTVCRARA